MGTYVGATPPLGAERAAGLIANDIAAVDLSQIGQAKALSLTMPTRICTIDKVTALKQVLARHPGLSDVHVKLVSGDRSTLLKLGDHLRVDPSSSLMGDLKALLGPNCLA